MCAIFADEDQGGYDYEMTCHCSAVTLLGLFTYLLIDLFDHSIKKILQHKGWGGTGRASTYEWMKILRVRGGRSPVS